MEVEHDTTQGTELAVQLVSHNSLQPTAAYATAGCHTLRFMAPGCAITALPGHDTGSAER